MLFWISLLLAQDPSFVQIAPSMAKIKDVLSFFTKQNKLT